MKIEIRPTLFLSKPDASDFSLARGLALLDAIEKSGNLQAASKALSISYRHAWTSLVEMETMLGGSVVDMVRGRGSKLTELGQRLLWAQKRIHARLDPLLDSMSSELEAEIQSAISRVKSRLRIHASHGFAVAVLHEQLQLKDSAMDLNYRGSLEAVSALSRGACDIAGFHVPLGALEMPVFRQFEKFFRAGHRLIGLATRRQGIMVAKGNPKKIWSIKDLLHPEVRFVNRQQGSGTRLMLELLLEQDGIDGRAIDGFESVEFTHAAVAAHIASGKADAGMGVETAARQFDLEFVPILTERYFLLCDETTLADPRFLPVMAMLQTSEFRTQVSKLPGYDAANTGTVMTVQEAFPQWRLSMP